MAERLSALDVSFLYLEEPNTAMHVGGVSVFQSPEGGFDYATLVALIRERIAFVPRFRQRVRWVPGHFVNPIWVDDENFDITYHVRRSALPRPGDLAQLAELVARVQSRKLDRSRPLWEIYLVEGLADDRFALITKTHHAMVDGVSAVDLGQVILDVTQQPRPGPPDVWRPTPGPSWAELVVGGVNDLASRPSALVDTVRGALDDVRTTSTRVLGAAGGLLTMVRSAARPAQESPLNVPIGEQRRYAILTHSLEDYKAIRRAYGGTINDVVLAVVAGGLRAWLQTRGDAVSAKSTMRAMVPVSVRPDAGPDDTPGMTPALGSHVSSYLVDLPVGEPRPVMRLHRVSYAMQAHEESGQAIGADTIVGLAGFAPPTLHSLGARVGSGLSRRLFNLVVTNVPGPQFPLYAAGAQLLASYPVVPLAKSQALSIGITSYNGGVFWGLNADRDALKDLDILANCLDDSLTELVETIQ